MTNPARPIRTSGSTRFGSRASSSAWAWCSAGRREGARSPRESSRLDGEYRRGLAHCARHEFVSSHAAFAYLAARYGLHMVAITGIDPESEPSAQKLAVAREAGA